MIIKGFKRWKKQQQQQQQLNKDIGWKPLNVFDYLKGWSQKTQDLIN